MYRLTADQQQIVERLGPIADRDIAPNAARADREAEFPASSMAALGAGGFLGLTVPTAFGGLGQGLRVAAAVIDEIAQRCPSTAMVYLMHLCGVGCYAAAPDRTPARRFRGRGPDSGCGATPARR